MEALREGKAFRNAGKTYAEVVAGHASPDVLNGIAQTHLSHPTDSHPPLSVRLDALQMSIAQVSAAALDVRPTRTAIELLPAAKEFEETMSGAYQALLARQYGIDRKSETTVS